MRFVQVVVLACAPAALSCGGQTPTASSRNPHERFAGVWTGTVALTQIGGCPFVGGPRPVSMQWNVAPNGQLTITEGQSAAAWTSAAITDDLKVTANRADTAICGTTRTPYNAAYAGTIRGAGPYQIDLEGVEAVCPPDCVFRVVYALSKP
jgi:hypothetical protein